MPTTMETGQLGHRDFDLTRLGWKDYTCCPVRNCSATLLCVAYGKERTGADGKPARSSKPWCPVHGIRLHAGTFVYWNGPGQEDESRLRNFIVEQDLARTLALQSGMKAETHRLGYEMSEDALSWNVFVSLQVAGKLRDAAQVLSKRSIATEPRLFLWGREVVAGRPGDHAEFQPLIRVRKELEPDIQRFGTEPDIMLVSEELLISVEAKFGSGNALAYEGKTVGDGEKPTARSDLLERYLPPGKSEKYTFLFSSISPFRSFLYFLMINSTTSTAGTLSAA